VLLAGLMPARAWSKTIFDDDWKPPVPATKPAPEPTRRPPATPADETPKPSDTTTAPAAPQRRPVPPAAAQANSRKLFRDLYAADLANHSPAARRALAAKLIEQAGTVGDAPADQFVLLAGAVDAAKEGADLGLVSRAADAMADAYVVDGLHVKSEAAAQMPLRADVPATTAENCKAGAALADQLAADDDFAAAFHLLRSLQAAAPDAETRAQLVKRAREIEALKAAADHYAMLAGKLKAAPNDPGANLAAGHFLCLVRNDWAHGLPLLAKGADPALKALANKELKNPADADGRMAIADAWWTYGQGRAASEKPVIEAHAGNYYRQALPDLKGMVKLKVEGRLAQEARDSGAAPGAASADQTGSAPPGDALAGTGKPRSQNIIWFRAGGGDASPFQAMSRNPIVSINPEKNQAELQNPNLYRNVTLVVWGTNQWRSTPVEAFTDTAISSLRQFVRNGGDLIIYEQFATTNMGIFDRAFGIKTGGAGAEAQIVFPPLRARLAAAGVSDDMLKEAHFYNSYKDLPPGSVVLVRDKGDRDVIAVAPFGRGRLILLGTNADPSERKLVSEVLSLIYHLK
jgi:hypothetical protein